MNKNLRERIRGSLLATVGFLLSPLSWWNDLYVNLPIAYVFSWLVSALFSKAWFGPAMILFYWLTNLAGLLLLHKGVRTLTITSGTPLAVSLRKRILLDFGLSLLYSCVVALLVYLNILRLPQDYF